MAQFFDMSRKPPVGELPDISSGDERRQRSLQRMQIGVAGVLFMVLLVGLAGIIQNRAAETDATVVPQAASTTEPRVTAPQNDPLAEAGVVPDLPAEPVATPGASPTAGGQGASNVDPREE
jgi:hypothetical protein